MPEGNPFRIGEHVRGEFFTDRAEEVRTAEDAALRRTWDGLSRVQKRVLRAVASGAEQLHSTETRERFALGASSSVTTALAALTDGAILDRRNGTAVFDSPFFRGWVRREVLGA